MLILLLSPERDSITVFSSSPPGGETKGALTFDYSASPYFASEECGALYYYHIRRLKHTTHLIDSIVITDSLITNADLERIRIYFRTSHDETPQQ